MSAKPVDVVRWGMIGCGDVTEVKSGPALHKASHSCLVAVASRDPAKAADYARRHAVPRSCVGPDDVIADDDVDAVYVATPPASHCELALRVAAAGKPCLVEKPMAINHGECVRMLDAFRTANVPLFVAYYRRALPRYLKARELLRQGAIGRLTSVHVFRYDRLAACDAARAWRFDPAVGGAGLFFDLASHEFDLLDFLGGPVACVAGRSVNTGGTYAAEDVTSASFFFESGLIGTGVWNFNASRTDDGIVFEGSDGQLSIPVFTDSELLLQKDGREERMPFVNPPHVHQPLIQTIVDELRGCGKCESTGRSAARASWVMDQCVQAYYQDQRRSGRPGVIRG